MTRLGRFVFAGAGAIGLTAFIAVVKKMFTSTREEIVKAAESQIGDQDPDKYWSVVAPTLMNTGAAWCGGFSLWVLRQAGLAGDIDWTVGRGFIFKGNNGHPLPTTNDPQPGDIAYFSNLQHHAIVKSYNPETGELVTIDGNQSPGEQVKQRTRNVKEASTFFSIEPLLQNV